MTSKASESGQNSTRTIQPRQHAATRPRYAECNKVFPEAVDELWRLLVALRQEADHQVYGSAIYFPASGLSFGRKFQRSGFPLAGP